MIKFFKRKIAEVVDQRFNELLDKRVKNINQEKCMNEIKDVFIIANEQITQALKDISNIRNDQTFYIKSIEQLANSIKDIMKIIDIYNERIERLESFLIKDRKSIN